MTLAATLTLISDRDHTLMRRVNRWQHRADSRLDAVRHARWRWVAVVRHGLVILLWRGQRFAAIGAAALAAGVGIAALQLKKARPQTPLRAGASLLATLLPPDQFSFPSGHTITACAVAVSLSLFYPELAAGLLFLRSQRGGFAHSAGDAFSATCWPAR